MRDSMHSTRGDENRPVLVWFRKDLRLADNHALNAAVETGQPVVPVYILEPEESGNGPLGSAQRWWLHHSLTSLATHLTEKGSRLILLSGEPLEQLSALCETLGASGVYWNRRHDPSGIAVDTVIKAKLKESSIEARSFAGQLLHDPARLKTGTGGPYRVYTPFWRAVEGSGEPPEPLDEPAEIRAPETWPTSQDLGDWNLLPTKPNWASHFSEIWTPGEQGATERLEWFLGGAVQGYKEQRNLPAIAGTSQLSPHLAFGEISPARVWHATRSLDAVDRDDVVTFRKELVWRDFSYHLLFHNPDLASQNLNTRFDRFPWTDNSKLFEAWTRGRTGYPIVDAGMRQLWKHGYMHNRVRMIAASFLIKHLLIDWRQGEAWFRDTLVDADPASNSASWQWVAGSGADAAPFFRIFNPILQGEKFDPDGTYVRTFVPELARLEPRFIHKPFDAPLSLLSKAGVVLGKTYPAPVVDHAFARTRALAAYSQIKEAA